MRRSTALLLASALFLACDGSTEPEPEHEHEALVPWKVAFESAQASIVVGDTETDSVAELAGGCYDPAWHPSGDWLVAACFEGHRWRREHESGLIRIWRDRHEDVLAAGPGGFADPAFSADGQWLFYRSFTGDAIWRARFDGASPEVVLRPPSGRVRSPAPSPAGDRVAYALVDGADTTVVILELASGEASELGIQAHAVAWSDDGERLALATPDGVTVVRLDGTDRRDFARPIGHAGFPPPPPDNVAWSPAGRVIGDFAAPLCFCPETRRRLFELDPRAGEWDEIDVRPHPAASYRIDISHPAWSR